MPDMYDVSIRISILLQHISDYCTRRLDVTDREQTVVVFVLLLITFR